MSVARYNLKPMFGCTKAFHSGVGPCYMLEDQLM